MTKRVKSSRAFASMAMGRRMRPESTMPLTADRLSPNPAHTSYRSSAEQPANKAENKKTTGKPGLVGGVIENPSG